jgi:CBS domain containing-hemolysin-like protein
VTQFGVTLASLGLGWIGEPAITRVVERAALSLTGRELGEILHVVVVGVAFLILTFSHVLLGELVPKLVAIQRSEQVALAVANPVRIIYFTFSPLLWVLEKATRVILRAMGLSADVASERTLPERELLGILAPPTATSPTGKEKSALLERVIRFAQRTARHSMVPRVDVASLPIDTSGKDAVAFLRKQGFSRIILTKERSLDEVAGYVYAKDFLLDPSAETAADLTRVCRDLLYVPETQRAIDVLRDMQREHTPIAIVVDEYGGRSGIVTMGGVVARSATSSTRSRRRSAASRASRRGTSTGARRWRSFVRSGCTSRTPRPPSRSGSSCSSASGGCRARTTK